MIAPTSLTYGIDQGYVRLPLILGSLTVDSASPLQPRTFELTDPSLVDADGGRVVELAIGADGLVTNVVSSRVLGTIENGLLSGTNLSAGVDSGSILDGASGSFFDKTGVSYYALAANGKAAASDSWMSMAITVTPSTVTDATSVQVLNADGVTVTTISSTTDSLTFALTAAEMQVLFGALTEGASIRITNGTATEDIALSNVTASITLVNDVMPRQFSISTVVKLVDM